MREKVLRNPEGGAGLPAALEEIAVLRCVSEGCKFRSRCAFHEDFPEADGRDYLADESETIQAVGCGCSYYEPSISEARKQGYEERKTINEKMSEEREPWWLSN